MSAPVVDETKILSTPRAKISDFWDLLLVVGSTCDCNYGMNVCGFQKLPV